MIQPKYSPEEALDRMKLMMNYDSSKTLTENVQSTKKPVNEVFPTTLAAVGPWIAGLLSPTAWALGGIGGVAALATWIYNVQGGGDSFEKTKRFFDGCDKNMKNIKPTVDKQTYRAAADKIYNAIEGLGTDEEAIKSALMSMPTVADLCALNSWYSTQYGDLYDDLDSDIDGTDFIKYVWSAIAPQIADAEDDVKKTEEIVKDCKENPNQEKCKSSGEGYKDCTGFYQKGCKTAPDGPIGKVQGCLGGLKQDGKFGPNTEAKLKEKFPEFVGGFRDSEIDKICSGSTTKQPTTGVEVLPDDTSDNSVMTLDVPNI